MDSCGMINTYTRSDACVKEAQQTERQPHNQRGLKRQVGCASARGYGACNR